MTVELRLDGLVRSAIDEMTGKALTVLDRGCHYELLRRNLATGL